jgi:hypothetical protein
MKPTKPTRMIVQTMFPIATVDDVARGGHLQAKFEMIAKNYIRCWDAAHQENAERDGRKNVSPMKRKQG